MRELVQLVGRYGLSLHASHLPDDVRGYYSPHERRIYFDLSLTPNERRATIAHELGHHHHGHDCSSPANERQADVYAATLLIHPDDYAQVARVVEGRAEIADELNVTEDIVEAFERHCIERIGDAVYTRKHLRGLRRRYHAEGPEGA